MLRCRADLGLRGARDIVTVEAKVDFTHILTPRAIIALAGTTWE